jgi:hypothetical protein
MSVLSEVVSFTAYVIAWLAVGIGALAFFDDDGETLFNTYSELEHGYETFLFIALWPLTLAAFWLGFLDPPDSPL